MKGSKRVARSGDVEVPDDEESSEDWMVGVDRTGGGSHQENWSKQRFWSYSTTLKIEHVGKNK